jgi:N,N-dimethylglycine/sarcosine catabolism electron transfer flavoprotein subunit beta
MRHNLNVTALVSVGQHPTSGRARCADQDARAVELGLTLCGEQLTLLHAGDPGEQALRGYLGMGLTSINVLPLPPWADAIESLCEYLNNHRADVVLTGGRAECGEASGMTPYLLSQRLGWPVVTHIADIVKIEHGVAEVLQALPRGQRRTLTVALPFVASVDTAAKAPRQSAYGPAQRATINTVAANVTEDAERNAWQQTPARKRGKRLKVAKAKTAAERFKAATVKSSSAGGVVISDKSVAEQAQAVIDVLIEEGVLR